MRIPNEKVCCWVSKKSLSKNYQEIYRPKNYRRFTSATARYGLGDAYGFDRQPRPPFINVAGKDPVSFIDNRLQPFHGGQKIEQNLIMMLNLITMIMIRNYEKTSVAKFVYKEQRKSFERFVMKGLKMQSNRKIMINLRFCFWINTRNDEILWRIWRNEWFNSPIR